MDSQQVSAGMPVVCSNDGQFAVVDHLDGDKWIKLKKGDGPTHHWIPTAWVASVQDGKVKVDRPGQQAMQQWSTTRPDN